MANKQRGISGMRANTQERKKIEGNGDAFPEDEVRKKSMYSFVVISPAWVGQ